MKAVGPGSGSPLLSFEFRHLGGALGRRAEDSGALGALSGEFMTFAVGILPVPEMEAPLRSSFAAAREALEVLDNGMPMAFAQWMVGASATWLRYYAGSVTRIHGKTAGSGMNEPGRAMHLLSAPAGVLATRTESSPLK